MQDNTVQIDNRDEIVVNLFVLARRVREELKRYALIILLVAALVGAACYVSARASYKPTYKATATFMINRVSGLKYKTGSEKHTIINRVGALFPYMLKCRPMKTYVMDDLGLPDTLDYDKLTISATGGGGPNVIVLTVRAEDPQLAYDALHSVLRNHAVVTEPAIGEVELKLISESGVPTEPATLPNNGRKVVGGILLVFAAALLGIVIKCIFKKTISTGEELSGVLETELLGALPPVKIIQGRKSAVFGSADCPVEAAESIRMIRHRLKKAAGKCEAKTILVTSTLTAEGKTTIAANLALALAAHQHKVLLVEGNLRNPSILEALGMPKTEKGLADLLAGNREADKAMISYQGDANLTLLPGGTLSGLPMTLWSNPEAEQLFKEWRERFDYILIDASAAGTFAESGLIARLADGCLYVGQANRVDAGDIRKGAAAVTAAGCRILGCVLNADR